jgi:prepilin-type N-terminal cleavage/methylation domain-containing protein
MKAIDVQQRVICFPGGSDAGRPGGKNGFTLVEMILAVSLIGLLAVLMIPAVNQAVRSRQNAECANKLRTAVQAFELCKAETGAYPMESTAAELTDYYFPYFKIDWWDKETGLGGHWAWEVNSDGIAFSVSIRAPTASEKQLKEFDRLIDDGDLDSGTFRRAGNTYHFIVEN